MIYPDKLIYTKEHVWLEPKGKNFALGITHFAQDLLGDIVYLEIKVNSEFKKFQALGSIESVKTASDIIAPESGKIILVNPDIELSPEKINDSPFSNWICHVSFNQNIDESEFLTKEEYIDLIKT